MLIPIGKLVDAYGLSGPDMEALTKALPCQAPDSIMNRFYEARSQEEGNIVDRTLNASMGLNAVEYIVVFFRTWAQTQAEKDYQRDPFPFGGLHAFYSEFINPTSVKYLVKILSIFHQLANEACGRAPLCGWDEIAQNLDVKSGQDAGLALTYLAGELKKAALECCLIDKTEAMAFLVSNDYVFQKEVNGCSRTAHEAIVKRMAVDNADGCSPAANIEQTEMEPQSDTAASSLMPVNIPASLCAGKTPQVVFKELKEAGHDDELIAFVINEKCGGTKTEKGRLFCSERTDDAPCRRKLAALVERAKKRYLLTFDE